MTAKRTCIVAIFLVASALGRADAPSDAIPSAEYRAELDRLLVATQQLDSSGSPTPQPLLDLPQSWRVHSEQRDFDISTEGLKRDVRKYEAEKNAANAGAIGARLVSLRRDLDGFEKPAADFSPHRDALTAILSRAEFRDVEGPTWVDRL